MAYLWRMWFFFSCMLLIPTTYAGTKYKVAMEADDVVSRILFDRSERFGLQVGMSIILVSTPFLMQLKRQRRFCANVTYTEARAALFEFSSPTNIEYTYLYSLTNANLDQVATVGVPAGTIYGELIRANYPELWLNTGA